MKSSYSILLVVILSIGFNVFAQSVDDDIGSNECMCDWFLLGFEPIEFMECDTTIRIWIDSSSPLKRILTIYRDSIGFNGTYMELGYIYKARPFKRIKAKAVYKSEEICPIQGWSGFINDLKEQNFFELNERRYNPYKDGAPMSTPLTRYFVEINTGQDINRYEFYSFFPYPSFPVDMEDYKNIERVIFTSFKQMTKLLRDSQEYYNYRFEYEY